MGSGMSVLNHIKQLEDEGFQMETDGINIRIAPASRLTEEHGALIRQCKPLLIDYLKAKAEFWRICQGSLNLGFAGLWE